MEQCKDSQKTLVLLFNLINLLNFSTENYSYSCTTNAAVTEGPNRYIADYYFS